MVWKMVKINGEFAEASIKVSSSINKISIKYVKKRGLTWKCLNKINSGCMDDGFIGYIHGVEVDVKGVKAVQKFYIKCGLLSDIVLGMLWIVKTRCSFAWKDEKCHYTIESGNKKATFVIFDENIQDEYVMDRGNMIKNDAQRGNEFVDIRCVKGDLSKDDDINDEEKKKGIINIKMNFDESNRIGKTNVENIPEVYYRNNDKKELYDEIERL
ncbi:9371_t:CDS:2 [Dentiscutata erythropus]|uniref:9371_t:CDS:1 n=1 Tax=Dentiscutata erythropus TaxID=1348616 RepID=A0A9N9HQK4_9GLOM|nr:9371_t:CDS:2 [Dentiscutata erythropus]